MKHHVLSEEDFNLLISLCEKVGYERILKITSAAWIKAEPYGNIFTFIPKKRTPAENRERQQARRVRRNLRKQAKREARTGSDPLVELFALEEDNVSD